MTLDTKDAPKNNLLLIQIFKHCIDVGLIYLTIQYLTNHSTFIYFLNIFYLYSTFDNRRITNQLLQTSLDLCL